MTDLELKSVVEETEEALNYAGFDIVDCRESIIDKLTKEEIVKVMVVHIKTGSSIEEKVNNKKVADPEAGKRLIRDLKNLKIFPKRQDLTTLTVARVALCFPMILVEVRRMMKVKESKLATSTPYELQDLSFNGIANEPHFTAADDFIKKFSWTLAKVKAPATTSAESDERVMAFRAVGVSGRSHDVVGNEVLKLSFGQSLNALFTAYGVPVSTPLPVSSKEPATKAERDAFAKAMNFSPEFLKKIGYVEQPASEPNKKKIDGENLSKALVGWVALGT